MYVDEISGNATHCLIYINLSVHLHSRGDLIAWFNGVVKLKQQSLYQSNGTLLVVKESRNSRKKKKPNRKDQKRNHTVPQYNLVFECKEQ